MTLSPQDIQTKQFHVRFRGFDVEEVDAFLERIAEEFLILIQENKQLKDRVDTLSHDIAHYKLQEKKFQDAILSAHTIADEMKVKSKQQSETLIAETKEQVKVMQDKAQEEITGLEATIVNLKELKDRVHEDVRHLLDSYLEKIEEVSQGFAIDYVPEKEKKSLPPVPENNDTEENAEQLLAGPAVETMSLDTEQETTLESLGPWEDMEDAVEFLKDDEVLVQRSLFPESGPRIDLEARNTNDDDQVIPDIDGELLFSLDDPLDHLESDLTEDETGKKTS